VEKKKETNVLKDAAKSFALGLLGRDSWFNFTSGSV
jgi:hypothetical protein